MGRDHVSDWMHFAGKKLRPHRPALVWAVVLPLYLTAAFVYLELVGREAWYWGATAALLLAMILTCLLAPWRRSVKLMFTLACLVIALIVGDSVYSERSSLPEAHVVAAPTSIIGWLLTMVASIAIGLYLGLSRLGARLAGRTSRDGGGAVSAPGDLRAKRLMRWLFPILIPNLVGMLLIGLVWYFLLRGRIESGREVQIEHAGGSYVSETIEELVRPFRKLSAIKAEALTSDYIGQRLLIEGSIRDVTQGEGHGLLFIASGLREPYVSVYLDQDEVSIFSGANKGDHLVFAGDISEIGAAEIKLRDIEIFEGSKRSLLDSGERLVQKRASGNVIDERRDAEKDANVSSEPPAFLTGKAVGWSPEGSIIQVEESLQKIRERVGQTSSYRSQQILAPYSGKWYAVEGVIRDVSRAADGSAMFVSLRAPFEERMGIVIMRFTNETFEEIEYVDIGYRLAGACRIESIENYGGILEVSLQNCQVIRVSPPEPGGGNE